MGRTAAGRTAAGRTAAGRTAVETAAKGLAATKSACADWRSAVGVHGFGCISCTFPTRQLCAACYTSQ